MFYKGRCPTRLMPSFTDEVSASGYCSTQLGTLNSTGNLNERAVVGLTLSGMRCYVGDILGAEN